MAVRGNRPEAIMENIMFFLELCEQFLIVVKTLSTVAGQIKKWFGAYRRPLIDPSNASRKRRGVLWERSRCTHSEKLDKY